MSWRVALVALAAASIAHADTPRDAPAAVEVDRDPAPAGRVGFGFDGGEPVDAWGISLSLGWVEQPIRLHAGAFGAGSPATQPVRRRETLAVGGAVALGESVVVDARLRGSHQVGDRLHADGDPAGLARYVLHDLRFGLRIRVVGDDQRAAFLRGELTLPTGDDAQLAGDARWTGAWSLIGRLRLPRDIAVAASAGVRLHGAEVIVGDRVVGDELFAAAGVAVPLPVGSDPGALRLTGELLGALGDHVGTLSGPSPAEARIGALFRPMPALTVGAHLGVGLDDQIGAPRFRALVELAWNPPAPHRPRAPTPDEPPDEPDESDDADPPP